MAAGAASAPLARVGSWRGGARESWEEREGRRDLGPATRGAVPDPRSAVVLAEQEGAPFLRAGGGLLREARKELKQRRDGTAHLGVRKRKKKINSFPL